MSSPKLLVKGTPPPPLERDLTVIGRSLDRFDAAEKVMGKAPYIGDLKLDGLLHAAILRCPYSHARIVKIDTSKAESLPGVKAVISRNNASDWRTYWYMIPQPAFPEIVTFSGQEVAVVAAEDMDNARKALASIDVEYEVLPGVLDSEEALKDDAPFVQSLDEVALENERAPHAKQVGNMFEGTPHTLRRGDTTKGFQEADVIIEDTYQTSFQWHAALETRTCVAQWDGKNLTAYDSCQGIWQAKENLAKSLGLPVENVRVIAKYTGGGFGSKAGAQRTTHYAAKLAMMTGRPVKICLTRGEEFLSHPHRQSSRMYLKMGAKKDGTLTAIEGRCFVNIGAGTAYNQRTRLIEHLFSLHECPNAYLEQTAAYTNTPISGFLRSVMAVMGNFFIECHMDRMAAALDIDPYVFRMKNYTQYGDQAEKIPYSAKNLDKCMNLVKDAIGWERRNRLAELNKASDRKRGIGIASYMYTGAGQPPYKANAEVVIRRDGSVQLLIGVVDIGGGQATVLSMIAAEELGVDAGRIKPQWGDTYGTGYAPGSHASRVTSEMGPPVLQAAFEARQQIFAKASMLLDARIDDLASRDDYVYVKSDPSRRVSFEEVCATFEADEVIRGFGSRAPNPSEPVFRTFGAQAAEVEVDVKTGRVRVLKMASAHEVGRTINPKLCTSQHYGNIIMGIGYALFEEPSFDSKTGVLLSNDLIQYRLPTSMETPEIVAFNVEAEDPYFAYSAKGGIGEGGIVPTPAAIRNAIHHATEVWLNEIPMTPDRVLRALSRKKE